MIWLAILVSLGIAIIAGLGARAGGRGHVPGQLPPVDAAKTQAIQYFASGALPPWR